VKRFAAAAFGALVVATIAAFFVTQHLKVSTPLISGAPRPVPTAINPYQSAYCGPKDRNGLPIDHNRMRISFYLQHRADDVSVNVIDSDGEIVRTIGSRYMPKNKRQYFYWNGRDDGGAVVPDGKYYVRVSLLHQGVTADITDSSGHAVPVQVITTPPRPRVTSVQVQGAPAGSAPVISPPASKVTFHYTGTAGGTAYARIYRTDLSADTMTEVKSFKIRAKGSQATWDGLIGHQPAPQPAPQGTYLIGLSVRDAACNRGSFPQGAPSMPPPGTTPHAGVTVRYLAVQPPLTPTPAGSTATVYVAADHQKYDWTLVRAGAHKPSAQGSQLSYTLSVKLPAANDAGLYHLFITAGSRRTVVPLIADHAGTQTRRNVLVVLPALTWQGENPVDDPPEYDGVPNTLQNGGPVLLARPLVDGLPADATDEAALLAYLDHAQLPYDLTTDIALIDGTGPPLRGHTAVVLAGTETWVPGSLGAELRAYVASGGKLLSIGTGSLERGVRVGGGVASAPSASEETDAFGARLGDVVTGNTFSILVSPPDRLHLFGTTSGAFSGYSSYQPISPPTPALSQAGAGKSSPSIVAYRVGRGVVIDIGIAGFGSSLAHNVNAKELVSRLWMLLRR
jgi:hypothetical protein